MHLDSRWLLAVTLAFLLLVSRPTAAQRAGSPGLSGVQQGVRSPYRRPIRPVVQWTFTFQTEGLITSPTIGGDGTIYVGANDGLTGYLYALGPDSTVKWRVEIGRNIGSSLALGEDGTIYVTAEGKLYAISPRGRRQWTYEIGGGNHTLPAIGTDGTIYVGAKDSVLYALRPDGSPKWTYSVVGLMCSVSCGPAVGPNGTIYVEAGMEAKGGSNLYAISPEGALKWRYPLDGESGTTPAIGPGGTIYVGGAGGYLYAIRPDKSLRWKFLIHQSTALWPSMGPDRTIYVSYVADGVGGGSLGAFYPDGSLKWTYDLGNSVGLPGPPVVSPGGIIYVTAESSSIGFNYYTHLYAIGPGGHLRWKLRFEGLTLVLSAPALGPDGRLYVSAGNDLHAIGSATVSAAPPGIAIPDEYELHANYPNPFNPATTISYSLPEAGRVTLQVFDLFGRRVRVLVDGRQTAGRHEVRFDGSGLPSGVYIYRLQAGTYRETRRMVLIK